MRIPRPSRSQPSEMPCRVAACARARYWAIRARPGSPEPARASDVLLPTQASVAWGCLEGVVKQLAGQVALVVVLMHFVLNRSSSLRLLWAIALYSPVEFSYCKVES